MSKDVSRDGGDVIFVTGAGGSGDTLKGILPGKPGSFIFKFPDGREVLRMDDSGEVFVNGELAKYDKEVYDTFLEWLQEARSASVGG